MLFNSCFISHALAVMLHCLYFVVMIFYSSVVANNALALMCCSSCFFIYALSNLQDYLREEKREVNHHGRVRTIGEEGEDIEEDSEERFLDEVGNF